MHTSSPMLNNPRTIRGWALYDWANSVYSLVITTTVFPGYYAYVTSQSFGGKQVKAFGATFENTALYSFAISASFLIIALISPTLASRADAGGNKKSYMRFFTIFGSLSCLGLYFFTGKNLEFGLVCSILASIGFAGAQVFYNAFLPEVATPDQYDRVSAKGFAMGYIGSVILLVLNLVLVLNPNLIGLTKDTYLANTLPPRISFLTVGLWWFVFGEISLSRLKERANPDPGQAKVSGYSRLNEVWNNLGVLVNTKRFLIAYFFYNAAVQTVMLLAASYGASVLLLETSTLIQAILIIQLVAIGGTHLFARIAKKRGSILSISIMLVIWLFIVLAAYNITPENGLFGILDKELGFFVLALVVGLVMGGIQSTSRATYARLLPETENHASYFSFYDVVDKLSIVIGTLGFGLITQYSSMRDVNFLLGILLLLGLLIIRGVKVPHITAQEA